MTLATVLRTLVEAVAAVDGVQYAPAVPPEQAADFPFVVVYPGEFTALINTPEDYRMLWDLKVELHIARKDLPEDVTALLPYAETVTAALLGACVSAAIPVGSITGSFGAMEWAGVQTIGYLWTVRQVKVLGSL